MQTIELTLKTFSNHPKTDALQEVNLIGHRMWLKSLLPTTLFTNYLSKDTDVSTILLKVHVRLHTFTIDAYILRQLIPRPSNIPSVEDGACEGEGC